jgi:hypothetical protein
MQSTSDEVNFLHFPTHKKWVFLRMAQKIAVRLICKCLYKNIARFMVLTAALLSFQVFWYMTL